MVNFAKSSVHYRFSVMVMLYKIAPAALLVQIVLQFRRGVRKQGTHRRLFR